MASVWDLLKDLLPAAAAKEARPLSFLRDALADAPPGPVVAIGLPDDLVTALSTPLRPISTVRWPSSLVPVPAGHGPLASRGRLPQRKRSCSAVLVAGAFETCDDPRELVAAIVRVVCRDGIVAGLTSSREPSIVPVARPLPVVGLRLILESSGLAMTSVVPGPDVNAALAELQRGQHGWPVSGEMSAGNRDILTWGENTGRSVAQVRHRMLQLCATYAWTAKPAHTPTPWLNGARNVNESAPNHGQRTRRFALAVPDGESTRELVMEAPRSGFVARELATKGLKGYEPNSISALLAACDLAPQGAVFDVGANVGVFALAAGACTDRRVVAFEPMPGLAATARAACSTNSLTSVNVEEIALAAESGTATFYVSAQSDASNSLNPRHRAFSHIFEVALETLDSYAARTSLIPAVIKIDTETTEPDVIRGALGTLAAHRPWIICEVLASGRPDEIYELMAPLGYSYYWISGQVRWELASRPVPMPKPGTKNFNWLFTPEPLGDDFWTRLDDWRARVAVCGSREF